MHASYVTLHHLPPSLDADEDVSEVNGDYLKTVTAEMTSMVFNFLLCNCNECIMFKKFCPVFHVKYGGATYTRM